MPWEKVFRKLPLRKDIWPVYAVIVFMVYTWSVCFFFWEFPSWSYFMTLGELLAVFSYVMLVCLIESLVFLAGLLAVCMLLPSAALKEDFIVRGSFASLSILLSIMAYWYFVFPDYLLASFAFIILVTGMVAFAAVRLRGMRVAAIWLSDRLVVFLYLYLPLSALALAVVFLRNTV